MDPLTLGIGAGVSLLGGLFGGGGGGGTPTWYNARFQKELGLPEGVNDYGWRGAMQEYGNVQNRIYGQGQSLLGKAMGVELNNLRMAAAETTPTMATFRGYTSSQGVPTGISNVLAQQQAKAAQARSQDWLGAQSRDIGSRYSRDLSNLLIQSQQAATPFYGMGMEARNRMLGEQTENIRMNRQATMSAMNQEQMFNTQGRYNASVAASQQQNPWVTTGMGLLGGALGQIGQSFSNPFAGASSTGGYGTPGDMGWGGSSFVPSPVNSNPFSQNWWGDNNG